MGLAALESFEAEFLSLGSFANKMVAAVRRLASSRIDFSISLLRYLWSIYSLFASMTAFHLLGTGGSFMFFPWLLWYYWGSICVRNEKWRTFLFCNCNVALLCCYYFCYFWAINTNININRSPSHVHDGHLFLHIITGSTDEYNLVPKM